MGKEIFENTKQAVFLKQNFNSTIAKNKQGFLEYRRKKNLYIFCELHERYG